MNIEKKNQTNHNRVFNSTNPTYILELIYISENKMKTHTLLFIN